MPASEPITITLTAELSERVRAQIADHGYSSPLAVIAEGLDMLDLPEGELRGDELPEWMANEIVEACEEYDRDPSQVRTMEQVKETLAAEYRRAMKSA